MNAARDTLTDRLMDAYQANYDATWLWFEKSLTYDNGALPHALILSGYWTSQPEVLNVGLASLRWLCGLQTSDPGVFSPIGSNGFYKKGGERAWFDQQPIEAYSTLSACLEANRITGDSFWLNEARRAFEWFLGRNALGLPLYDSATGGCRDGLHSDGLNQNEGAESTLAFHLSHAEMQLAAAPLRTTSQPQA